MWMLVYYQPCPPCLLLQLRLQCQCCRSQGHPGPWSGTRTEGQKWSLRKGRNCVFAFAAGNDLMYFLWRKRKRKGVFLQPWGGVFLGWPCLKLFGEQALLEPAAAQSRSQLCWTLESIALPADSAAWAPAAGRGRGRGSACGTGLAKRWSAPARFPCAASELMS